MAFWNLMGKLGIDISQFEGGMKKAESVSVKFGRQLKNAIGGYLTVSAIRNLAQATVDLASQITDVSARLGISTNAFQEWTFAAKQAGGTAEDVTSFFEKLAVSRSKALGGDKGAIDAFSQFGVSINDLSSLPLEKIGEMVGKVFETENPQKFIEALRTIGGRGAGGLIPAFTSGLSDAAKEAHRLGLILDTETLNLLDDFGDRIDILLLKLKVFFAYAAAGFVSLGDIFQGLFKTFKEGGKWWELPKNVALEFDKSAAEEEARAAKRASVKKFNIYGVDVSGDEQPKPEGIFKPGGGKVWLDSMQKKPDSKSEGSGFSAISGTPLAAMGGFFLGADAAIRSIPSQQLDRLKSIDEKITNIERVVTEQ